MTILSDKIVQVRKRTQCLACFRYFEPGTQMRKQVNTFDGLQTWVNCITCNEIMPLLKDLDPDETYGCVKEELRMNETPEELLQRLIPPK